MSKFPEPLGELVFVVPESEKGTLQTLDAGKSWRGKVVATGPGLPLPDGTARPMDVAVGDFVRLKPSNAIESVFNHARCWIVRESDLLAVEVTP